jgi:hypothetical protein
VQRQEDFRRFHRWILLGIILTVVIIDLAYFLFPGVDGLKGAAIGMAMMSLPVLFYYKPKLGLWAFGVSTLFMIGQFAVVVLIDSGLLRTILPH